MTSRYPEMSVDTAMITRNAEKVVGLCSGKGISVWGVTKGLSAHPAVASAMLDGGCVGLADSRVDNIRKLRLFGFRRPMMLLRIPMPGEMTNVAENVDCCLVSMPASVLMLDQACDEAGSEVGIIVMVDLGDLREGIWPDGVEEMADALLQSRRTRCLGVGSNLGCLSGVLPSVTNLSLLVRIGGELSNLLGHPLEAVSYTHLRAHETPEHLVCRLLLEKKKKPYYISYADFYLSTNSNYITSHTQLHSQHDHTTIDATA